MLTMKAPGRRRRPCCLRRLAAPLAATALAAAAPATAADGKLVDGFATDQLAGGVPAGGPDILVGQRSLFAMAVPAADAVRVEHGRLFVDTRTAFAQPSCSTGSGAPANLALDDQETHGDWPLTYPATQATVLTFSWQTESASGPIQREIATGTLAPSAGFTTMNLGPLVTAEFPLARTRNLVLKFGFDGMPGSFELDAIALAAPVPEPAAVALWLAGLAVLARRTARPA